MPHMPHTKALSVLFRRLSAVVLVLSAFCVAAGQPDPDVNNPRRAGNASVRPETDDANLRREAQRELYETPLTPDFLKFMNSAAARERARHGSSLPAVDSSGNTSAMTPGIASGSTTTSGTTWTNLGPTKADVIKNGGTTLYKTDAGRPVAIVPDPTNANVLYVAFAGGGVWKSLNAQATQPTWTPITESLGTLSCGALALDPNNTQTVYLGLGDSFDGTGIGFTKSINGGATWGSVIYLGNSTKITDIKVATNSTTLLVSTDKGLFRSTDSGATFALVPLSTGGAGVPAAWSIASGGGTNYAISLEASPELITGSTNGQIWTTTDSGATWARASGPTKSTGIGRLTVASSPLNRLVMFVEAAIPNSSASTDLADFFRSADGGRTWTAMGATAGKVSYTNRNIESTAPSSLLNGQGWYNQLVIPSKLDTNTVFFGGALLLAKATSATTTRPSYTQMSNWLAQFSLPYVHADFHAGAYDANGNLYVGSDGGIFVSADNGLTWSDKCNIGITTHLLYSVGSSEAAAAEVVGGFQDNGTRVRAGSTSTFNQYLGGDGFGSHINAVNGMQMLGSLYYARIYKSTDSGATFLSASSGITESNSSSAPFVTKIVPWSGDGTGNTMFTHVNLKVYKSTNYAGSWTSLGTTGFITTGVLRNIGVARSSSDYIGAAASGGRVFLSSNGGTSWTQTSAPTRNGLSMNSVSFDPVTPTTVYVSSVAPDPTVPHLWKSMNSGGSWQVLDAEGSGFPSGVPVNSISNDPTNISKLYAGTHLGVYQSADGGATWTRFGAGMPLVNVTDLYVAPNSGRFRAATFGRGFWEMMIP